MRTNYRGLFWPAILILAGVLALLANAGIISTDRLGLLFDLWPLVLVVIGLELIARRALQGPASEVAAVLIVLIAVVGALGYVALAPSPNATGHMSLSSPAGSLDHASLEIDVGAASITVQGGAPEGDLFQANIDFSGSKPGISLDTSSGKVTISQRGTSFNVFGSHRFTLRLLIDANLPWSIVTNSGASTDSYNLAGVHVSSVEINTGASRDVLTLDKPSGVVPISVNGGALTVNIHRPASVAASVTVSGGAVSLVADDETHRGFGEQTWQTSNFDGAADGYRVQVNGGACTVTMDTAASSV